MAQALFDLVSSFGSCLNCFPSSPTLKINNRSFKILRLLGEVRTSPLPRSQTLLSILGLFAELG